MRKDVDCDAYDEKLDQEADRVAVNGIWVFVFIDMIIFFLIFFMFMKEYSLVPSVFVESKQQLSKSYPLINTVFLLVSSWAAFEGVCAARRKDYRSAHQFLAAVLIFGFLFVLVKVAEYYVKFSSGITPITNEFYTFYFFATLLHLAHVLVGLFLINYYRNKMKWAHTPGKYVKNLEGAGIFWHYVDLLWLFIIPIIYFV